MSAAAAVAAAAALACLCVCLPFFIAATVCGANKCSTRRKFFRTCGVLLQNSFLGVAALPAAAVLIALFPLTIPAYHIIHEDDD
jgi:hypothetical protein